MWSFFLKLFQNSCSQQAKFYPDSGFQSLTHNIKQRNQRATKLGEHKIMTLSALTNIIGYLLSISAQGRSFKFNLCVFNKDRSNGPRIKGCFFAAVLCVFNYNQFKGQRIILCFGHFYYLTSILVPLGFWVQRHYIF